MAWIPERHYDLGAGIYRLTSWNDPEFPENALYDAYNVVYDKESNNVEFMPGSTRVGLTDMAGHVTGIFDYGPGTRPIATCSDGKFYQYTAGDWAVESGARATNRWHGTMFYGQTTAANLLVCANGVDAPTKYNGTDVTALGGSPPATGNFPTVWQGRLWLAAGTTLYGSATDDAEDFAGSGATNFNVYRGFGGDITGIKIFNNDMFIFKRSSVFRIAPTASFTAMNIQNVSGELGCIAHGTIREAAGMLTFWSERGIEAITASGSYGGYKLVNISRWIKPILDDKNAATMGTAFSVWNLNRMELYSWFPVGTDTLPTGCVIGNLAATQRYGARWTRAGIRHMTCGEVMKTSGTGFDMYVGDDNGRVYSLCDTDLSTLSGSPYSGQIMTKYYTQGMPERMKEYGWCFVEAETRGTGQVTVRQILSRPGSTTSPTNAAQMSVTEDAGWGEGLWGEAPWGGAGYAGEKIRPNRGRRGSGMRLVMTSTNWYRLLGVTIATNPKRVAVAA